MIDALITRLIHEAPALDPQVIDELRDALLRDGRPLARMIAQVVGLVGEHLIDAGIALPALAMACTTLLDDRLTEREREAARYEIETLMPVPDRPAKVIAPDVPVSALSRGPRRQT